MVIKPNQKAKILAREGSILIVEPLEEEAAIRDLRSELLICLRKIEHHENRIGLQREKV